MSDVLKPTYRDVIVDTYAQKTAQRLGVDPEAVRAEFKKRGRARPALERHEAPDEPVSPAADLPPSEREFWLLRFVLLHDEQMDWVAQHLDLNWLEHATVKRILAARVAAHSSHNWRGVPGLIDDLDDANAGALITQAATEEHKKGDIARNIVEAVRLLRNDHFDRQLAALKLRLATPGLTEADTVQILREQADLRRARQQTLG